MPDKPSPFKTLGSRIAYKNPWMQVREDKIIRPDGSEGIYGVIESKDSVVVLAVNDQQEIGFINLFRYPQQKWVWELPGGGGEGQETLLASRRELAEETGIDAAQWSILGRTRVCNGFMTEYQTSVLATELDFSQPTDHEEGIDGLVFFSLSKIDQMIDEGDIDDGQSITALYLYKKWLDNQK